MDSQSASERLVTTKLASKTIRRNQNSFTLKNLYIKLFGSIIFLPVCNFTPLDVKGQLHEDVLLPCTIIYKDEFDYNLLVVHWQRPENDVVVHTFYYGSSQPEYQSVQYRGRTEMFYDLLPFGNLSLLLRNLSKSDAGIYTCHSVLKETSGITIQYVNLTLEGRSEDQNQTTGDISRRLIWIITLTFLVFIFLILCLFYFLSKLNRGGKDDEENKALIDAKPQESIIQGYKTSMADSMQYKDYSLSQRHLLVKKSSFLESSGKMKAYTEDKSETINAEELFTPENQQLITRRMLLLGDAGSGKSYFCKWLQTEWIQEKLTMYKCILYIPIKKIKNNMSLEAVCDDVYSNISSVLSMDNILLIFDGLDDLVCGNRNSASTQESEINCSLNVYPLLEKIMKKILVPDMDVLIVCRNDSLIDLQKECNSAFILLDFTEQETENIYNTITVKKQKSDKRCKKISDITHMPAFVVMMSHFSNSHHLEIIGDSSPYTILTDTLLEWTTNDIGESIKQNIFINMASQSYENLIKGEPNSTKAVESWDRFLIFYNCQKQSKYQRNILRDMLAAAHCVWEIHRTGGLKECLSFWVFGSNIHRNTELLKSVADEHNAKYYHFIRFFMRLLNYPDCESLCNNTPMKNSRLEDLLSDWFKENICKCRPSEKLKLIHCIFELHDEILTREVLSNLKKLELFNTPLNFKDIQALDYCFKDIELEELDLRLCALEDKSVKRLRSVIKNTKNVMLSSNHLTKEAGKLLGEILVEPGCIIERLSLGTNQLGDHGAQELWKALKHNKTLTGLYVYDNKITDEGTHGLVEHLQENLSLQELHLCGNTFGDDGLTNILKLKDTKKKLDVVLRIAENLELFEYVENKIRCLNQTWKSYDQKYLDTLLVAVLKDLEKQDCNKDPQITWERVDNLVQEIKKVQKE
ncbi:NACHT, LRR and PYD domains-containing protein 1 homolog [Ranitomeya variabilis]|uniref:NACHT, LRR and PYD domains-containing protein 1 homolog n=1 Tax=Ranitomeya variabilis TaxID=490064 RepID=UPI0040564CA2